VILNVYGATVNITQKEKDNIDIAVLNAMTAMKCCSCMAEAGMLHDEYCIGPEVALIDQYNSLKKVETAKNKQLNKLPKKCSCRECPKTGNITECNSCITHYNWRTSYIDDITTLAGEYYHASWFKRKNFA
jgi:hypothetical protein